MWLRADKYGRYHRTVAPLCLRESIYSVVLRWLLKLLAEEVRHVSSRPLFTVWRQSIVSYPGSSASRPSPDTHSFFTGEKLFDLEAANKLQYNGK